jgi:hypothetical protein
MTYLEGPIDVSSSWVTDIGFVQLPEPSCECGIAVTYKSGVTCFYPGTTREQYTDMTRASSKGKWVHKNIISLPYQIV